MSQKEIFIIHPSVFHDAFRSDYETQYRQSSKDFFDLLLKHYREKGDKIAFTSWSVFSRLQKTEEIMNSKAFWIIPNQLVNIDLKKSKSNDLDDSIINLASRKSAKYTPLIVSTKSKDKINLQDTMFIILTPKEAIDFYKDKGRF